MIAAGRPFRQCPKIMHGTAPSPTGGGTTFAAQVVSQIQTDLTTSKAHPFVLTHVGTEVTSADGDLRDVAISIRGLRNQESIFGDGFIRAPIIIDTGGSLTAVSGRPWPLPALLADGLGDGWLVAPDDGFEVKVRNTGFNSVSITVAVALIGYEIVFDKA